MIVGRRISKLTDEELVHRFRHHKEAKVVGELFNRYALSVLGICRKYNADDSSAEDAAMQVFELLFSLLEKHDIQRFGPWLMMVTRNHCLMQLRKKDVVRASSADEQALMKIEAESAENAVNKETMLQLMETKMDELKPEQKSCLEMFYKERMTYSEIATALGMDEKSVKSHLQNGKRNLKLLMTK
ncbi:MAG: hypothetical protein RL226_163 [Bacteroidota bacterium]